MKRIFTLLLTVAAILSATAQPYLVGHRGSIWGVENTSQAFINGAKKGYDYLETDIKVTKDGKFVCWHDDNLTKASGQPAIASNTLSYLKSLKLSQTRDGVAYTGYICTLEEYLDICKEYGVAPVIEFKWATGINSNDCSNIPALVKIVEEKGFRNNCYIFTSMQKCLQYVKTNYPDMEIMYLCYDTAFESSRSWCITNKAHIGPGVGSGITKAGVQAYHDNGLLVNAWSINSTSEYTKYGNYGCDFITTDYLDPASLPTLSTPTTMLGNIKTDKNEVTLTAGVGESVYADITVSGSNMSGAISVSSSNSAFTVANNTSVSSGTLSGKVRVTFKPTAEGVSTGTITLKGTTKAGKAVSTTVAVTGKCSLKFNEVWNYSEKSGNTPTGTNWASDFTAIRNIAYGNGKLYVINPGSTEINVIDAQTGKYITSINTTGVTGGTYGVMDGQVVDGKLVVANLSTASALNAKVYVWDTDNSAPREILNTTDLGGCTRLGDCMSVQGNLTNGALIFLSGSTIVKYAITNGTVQTTPSTIAVTEDGVAVDAGTSPRVIAQADGKYWIIGRGIYPKLVSSTGKVELTLGSDVLNGIIDGNEFYPFTFKGKQYAFATTYATGSSTLTGCRAVLIDASNGWANAINVGEYPADGLGTTRNDALSTGIEVDVNGTEGVEMWVNCNKQGIAHYRYGAAKVHTTEPTLSVSPSSIALNAFVGESTTGAFNVSGVNITGNIKVALSGANANMFAVSATSVAGSGEIIVIYSPTAAGNHSATITVSATGATSKTITLNGVATEKPSEPVVPVGLTRLWQNTTNIPGLPGGGDVRFAAVSNGHLIAADKANNKIIELTETGTSDYYDCSLALSTHWGTTAIGPAISCDDAGNILIHTGWSGATSGTNFMIISADLKNSYKLDLSGIEGYTPYRIDQIGRIRGNMLSDEGGYIILTPNTINNALVVKVVNGEVDADYSQVANNASVTLSTSCIAQPAFETVAEIDALMNENGDLSNAFIMRNRSYPENVYFWNADNSAMEATVFSNKTTEGYATRNASVEGFDWFKIGNNSYYIMPLTTDGTTNTRGIAFAIFNQDGEIVAYHAENNKTGIGQGMGSFIAVPYTSTSVYIYHFVAGTVAEKFTFAVASTSGVEAIEPIENLNAPVEYYNLQGVKVANPSNGIFIKVQGNKATKVLVK